ncbi:MAG: HAMP domain-containing histidine kinase [Intrasporangium sp.]|uniref:sensor histidine kinase n=1 Tax=Intrasporangium sp. TaxID=1925024 RepID=UPI0026485E5B|nr:HAMP domain-containing sensor histidine kinase [Intrasporangium sp.]MDN5796856.1 HAMP domain-containing histidine kinase [Intrasporangium sp.]
MAQWTLRAKLVAATLALITVVSLLTSGFTIFALNRYLTSQVDDQLATALTQGHAPGAPPSGPGDDTDRGRGPGNEGLLAYLEPLDTGFATTPDNDRVALTAAQLASLDAAGIGQDGTTLNLGGEVGRYRLMARRALVQVGGSLVPTTVVVGLPTAPQEETVRRMVLVAILCAGAGIIVAGGVGTWIVRRSLAPLRRVAATASHVSELNLAEGQVALGERVPVEDTDTRTEVGQVGAAFNEMLDHVDEALTARHRSEQRVRQFVADASHELRTPLSSIIGYAELSQREPEPVPETVRHALRRIGSEAERMAGLVADLLLLARLDAGRPLDRDEVDLSMLAVNAVSDAHAAAPDHHFALDLPDEPVCLSGDEPRLHQVLANLLANARTHTPAGTTVTTSVRRDGDWIRVAVHDDGPGVPEALQPNVFERFARGDDARGRANGSTGLGLSIVAAVAGAHGGRVDLRSRPGDTTFAVMLPAG